MIRRLLPYAAAAAGILGFGMLYRGLAAGSLPGILTGLALVLLGLDRAGRALAASILVRGPRAAPSPPAPPARRDWPSSSGGGRPRSP